MKRRHQAFFLLVLCLLIYGCAHLEGQAPVTSGETESDRVARIARDNEIYRPYAERNSLEGYREFIAKYPDNINVGTAWSVIQTLELTDCYDAECLKAFIARYPSIPLIDEAKDRLKAIESKDFDKQMAADYGFDLPSYRLNLKRLRKELIDMGAIRLTHFSEAFSMITLEGKNFFCTHLTFPIAPILSESSSPRSVEELFDFIVAPQLDYLMVKFKKKRKIDGFSFKIIGMNSVMSNLELFFLTDQVDQYLAGSLAQEALLKASLRIPPPTAAPVPDTDTVQKADVSGQAADEKNPTPIALPWTSKQDGAAKNGEFVRTSVPAFSLKYPRDWYIAELVENRIFNANPQRTPSMQLTVLRMGNGISTEAGRLALGDGVMKDLQQYLIQKELTKTVHMQFARLAKNEVGDTFYEFLMTWRLRGGGNRSDAMMERFVSLLPAIATYGKVVFVKDHAIVLTGSTMGPGQQEQLDQLKQIFGTLALGQESGPSFTGATSTPSVPPPLPKKNSAPAPNCDIKINLSLVSQASTDYRMSGSGSLARITPPLFALAYPPDWGVQQKSDSLLLSAKTASALPSIQVMISRISGDEDAYLESFAENYLQWLKLKGTQVQLLYNTRSEAYDKHRAFEFEIRFKPQGKQNTPPRTAYGNVIAKDGYAIILAGETDGEVDSLKELFETIDLKPIKK